MIIEYPKKKKKKKKKKRNCWTICQIKQAKLRQKWVETNNDARGTYSKDSQIKF